MFQQSTNPFSIRGSCDPWQKTADYVDRPVNLRRYNCCHCGTSQLEDEIENLQASSTFALQESWDEINTLKSALSNWLSKIDSVEAKIAAAKDREREQQACIKELENEIQCEIREDDPPVHFQLLGEKLEQKLASQNRVIQAMKEAIHQNSVLLKRISSSLLV